MGQYSIKNIESLSGIKAHTLRIWEQRYGFLIPHRTDTNIRYYTDDQLKAVLNISLLNKNGYKISRIARMDTEEIKNLILSIADSSDSQDALLDSLIHSMIDFDEVRFEKTLNVAIVRMGFKEAFEHLLLPFLERTGLLWSTGVIKPVQEHFMSNLIKRKLCVAIDNQFITRHDHTRRFVLFLPEGEWHEIMLLFTDLLLRTYHHEVIYLGCSVPLDDMYSLGKVFKPDYLVSFITAPMQVISLQHFMDELSGTYPDIKIILGGPQIALQNPKFPSNVFQVTTKEDLLSIVSVEVQ
jgi:DNA-binding transcriptional MerR regulator